MWPGFWRVELAVSPKSQDQPVRVPSPSVELSVKFPAKSVVEAVKPAVGAWLGAVTVTDWLVLSLAPSSSVTVSVTV